MIFKKEKDEEIKISVRRHWTNVLGLSVFVLIMITVPIIMYFILSGFIHLTQGFYNAFILGIGVYYMFVVTLLFIGWLDYYLDVAIITNKRIVDIDQESLFNRRVSELHVSKVQDVTGDIKGILGTVLDFGDVHIQTAGAQKEFVLEKVPHPYKVAKIIIDLHQKSLEEHHIRSGHSYSHDT